MCRPPEWLSLLVAARVFLYLGVVISGQLPLVVLQLDGRLAEAKGQGRLCMAVVVAMTRTCPSECDLGNPQIHMLVGATRTVVM
jgi:hypothetical protein